MSKQEDMKNAINQIFQGLLNSAQQETEEDYGEVIDTFVNDLGDKLKDPSDFHLFITHSIEEVFEACLKRLYPNMEDENFYKLVFVYMQYHFVENQLEEIIIRQEGLSCSADKSSWLINSYLRYLTKEEFPSMTVKEKCFWKPRFGTGKQWMEFIDSINELYHGRSLNYMKLVATLSGIRNN